MKDTFLCHVQWKGTTGHPLTAGKAQFIAFFIPPFKKHKPHNYVLHLIRLFLRICVIRTDQILALKCLFLITRLPLSVVNWLNFKWVTLENKM